jgi:mRNA interferase MazF
LNLVRGALVAVELSPTVGHEQGGLRPCIVLSSTELLAQQRYPILSIIPVTGTTGLGAMYPILEPYSGGLIKRSSVLVDQIRSVAKIRIKRLYAPILALEMIRVDAAVRFALGL